MPWEIHLHMVLRGHKHYVTKYVRDVHKPGTQPSLVECSCGRKWTN